MLVDAPHYHKYPSHACPGGKKLKKKASKQYFLMKADPIKGFFFQTVQLSDHKVICLSLKNSADFEHWKIVLVLAKNIKHGLYAIQGPSKQFQTEGVWKSLGGIGNWAQ